MNKYDLQQYFNACKDSIEKQYQVELDKLAGEDEPVEIIDAFDPDWAYENERNNNL